MHRSNLTSGRVRRHALAAATFGIVLAVTPVVVPAGSLQAEAPATSVSGLSRGSSGDGVKTVQQALINQGVNVAGGADGFFGSGTEQALKSFQYVKGLPQTGVVDGATALSLGLASSPVMGLTQGLRSDAVAALQRQLISAGVAVPGGADGVFGNGTKQALQAFQTARGLSPTGAVNEATAAALGSVTPSVTPAPAISTSTSGTSMVGLKIGSRGEPAKRMQQILVKAGFTVVGGADGVFGVLTANALRSFQNANALAVSGVVDDATATLLERVAAGAANQSGSTAGGHDPSVSSPLLGLKYGSIGSDVKVLQQTLIGAGVPVHGGADGVFGLATQDAVKQYQAARGLEQTGRVDDPTANALASVTGTASGSAVSSMVGLRAGALGNTVKQLQQALIAAGVDVRGGADGIFGPATANALKSFQGGQGLPATGEVDAATTTALANPKAASAPASTSAAGGFAAFGEKGARVMALQQALTTAGLAVRGGVDGDFGGGTSAAVMDFQRARGLGVTGKVDDATAAALGLGRAEAPTAPDPSSVTLGAFPVQGTCGFGDTWGYPRSGGRFHQGVDIIAPAGRYVYAAGDGKIAKVYADYPGSLSGNGARVEMADGTYFFYAHLTGLAPGIELGVPVKAGQILGTVGATGNTNTAHLHFEVHPQGGSAVNPYPLVAAINGCARTDPPPQP